jgi:glycosyltransferase involved in cell wall biosynthesis
MAATNRIFSYSKGLVEIGHKVFVCSSKPGFNNSFNKTIGKFDGVNYQILSDARHWNYGKLRKFIFFLKAHFLFIPYLITSKKKNTNTIVLVVSNKVISIVFVRIITWLLGMPLLHEKSEFPFHYMSKFWIKRVVISRLYSNTIFKLFDGMIVISTTLKSFFKYKTRKAIPIITLPLTIDTQRFINASVLNGYPKRFIGYCGYMGGNKDGISDLLKAFSIVNHKFKDVKLVLVGTTEIAEMEAFKVYTQQQNITEDVFFSGMLDRNEIPGFLKSAEVLVLSRPDNLQASGGFPTKLGEYLASGKPVVVTKVGDIPNYLNHEKDSLLCEPGNIQDIANNIISVLENPSQFISMGVSGQRLAIDKFDYRQTAYELEIFLTKTIYGQ